jgi:Zn-dependent protease with chaperone function
MVEGRYFDASTSVAHAARLEAVSGGQWLVHARDESIQVDPLRLDISDRIGNIPRRVRFPGGAEFETADNDGIDAMLQAAHPASRKGWVHALERRWGIAVAALMGIVLISAAFLRFGLPALSGWAAHSLPPAADRLIGRESLQVLDRIVLRPSQLDAQRKASLQSLFTQMTAPLDDGHEYRLELRHSRALGPNAVALPSGIIIMTDELVALSKNDEEIKAVLAHEVGHVRGRHALQQLIRGAGISILALVVLGDVSSITALGSAAPALLQARNSREFEREADEFSRHWLSEAGIPTQRFDDILCRMSAAAQARHVEPPVFLSTHPATSQRAHCTAGKP